MSVEHAAAIQRPVHVGAYVSEEIARELRVLAHRNERTVSGELRHMLVRYLEEESVPPPRDLARVA